VGGAVAFIFFYNNTVQLDDFEVDGQTGIFWRVFIIARAKMMQQVFEI
jgi:hypothetical protein